MTNIAILASGAGSNARRIIEYFAQSDAARVVTIITDNPEAGVLKVAAEAGVRAVMLPRKRIAEAGALLSELQAAGADYVVLAGFLRLIPSEVVERYSGRMVNIHPSLLPAFGGKGMYGHRVHQAVMQAAEKESGITIHLVSEEYDRGSILAQYKVRITESDTAESLEAKIHALEHTYFPQVIERHIAEINECGRK